MDLKELTAFKTILDEGTFSRAAEKLNYAQSTITSQIQRLEKELGIPLFNRGWDAELTHAGHMLASEIDSLIQHWNYVAEQAKALQHDEIGSLRIGGIDSMMETVFPNALRKFREHKPNMHYHVVTGNTDFLSHSILQKELDFAICGEPSDASPFYFQPLYHEKITFIADKRHPLCTQQTIPLNELLHYPIIAGGPTCLYSLRLAKHFARFESSPNLNTISQISSIPHFVKNTSSVGVVLDTTSLIKEVATIDVNMAEPLIQIGILQRRGGQEYTQRSSVHLLLKIIREEIGGRRKKG
ncbi:LysR substrate-binding domain-containing protein [Paenibacillus alvei]|uniref:LysR substrate-binding domain-containing protein n=1 Tax=Paenibacillus alvei TaxID=44250 RepID=UPI0013DCAE84|nr:LysR family transcriptional regulator [Paenibacillus alvei]